jgi:PKD repeat protein
MKSLFCYSLLFLSLFSCKSSPDAVVNMAVNVTSKGTVQLSNYSKLAVANSDIDWGDGIRETTMELTASHTYKTSGTYTVTLTVYNLSNKSYSMSQKVNPFQ